MSNTPSNYHPNLGQAGHVTIGLHSGSTVDHQVQLAISMNEDNITVQSVVRSQSGACVV